jgi:hypothetical protein
MFNTLVYRLGKEVIQRGTTIHGLLKDLDCPETHHQFILAVACEDIKEVVYVCLDGDTYEVTPYDADFDINISAHS